MKCVNITNCNTFFFRFTFYFKLKITVYTVTCTNCTVQCTRNEDCSVEEACFDGSCHRPCDVRNPCAPNAACLNVNHGTDCSCLDGYEGNGYTSCHPGKKTFI